MKRSILIALFASVWIAASAQQVGSYTNSFFDDSFSVTAVKKKDGALSSVRVSVLTHYYHSPLEMVSVWKDYKQGKLGNEVISQGSIGIEAKNIEAFKAAMLSARDEYLKMCKTSQENGAAGMKQKMKTKFPKVFASWCPGNYNEWFKWGLRVKLTFQTMDGGRMVAIWNPRVTVTNPSNRQYTDMRDMYLVLACKEDFDSIVSLLDVNMIQKDL